MLEFTLPTEPTRDCLSLANRATSTRPAKPLLGDFRDCQTDGHYLCQECAHRANHSTRPDGEWIKVECVADGSGGGG